MTVEQAYKNARIELASLENGELEARWLVSETAGLNEISLWSEPNLEISLEISKKIQDRIMRRKSGEPLAYILGFKDFYKSRFVVSPAVLIPRPETEIIVSEVLKATEANPNGALQICDIGCGSGCIGLSLLKERNKAQLVAIDISPAAVDVAKKNAVLLNIDDRVTFINQSAKPEIFKAEQFDIVVSNPPYIAPHDKEVAPDVYAYEPHSALYADANGLRFVEEWLGYAAKSLKSKGIFAFEIGKSQAREVKKIIDDLNVFTNVQFKRDLQNIERVVIGERR